MKKVEAIFTIRDYIYRSQGWKLWYNVNTDELTVSPEAYEIEGFIDIINQLESIDILCLNKVIEEVKASNIKSINHLFNH